MITTPQNIIQAFGQLIQTMVQCRDVYLQLIEAAEKKQKLIMAGNINELGSLVKVENVLLAKFDESERSMRHAVSNLQQALGMNAEEQVPLTEIRLLLEAEQQEKLLHMQQQLSHMAKRLQVITENNQLLMKQDLAMIHDMLDSVLGSGETDYIYDNPKAEYQAKRPSGIDYRT